MADENSESGTNWDESIFGPLFAGHSKDGSHLEPFLGGWIYEDDQGALAFKLTRDSFERLDERSEPEQFGYEVVRSAPGVVHLRLLGENDDIEEEQILECKGGELRCFDEDGTRLAAFQRVRAHGAYHPKALQISDSPVFESMPDQAERMRRIHEQHEDRMRQYVGQLLAEGG